MKGMKTLIMATAIIGLSGLAITTFSAEAKPKLEHHICRGAFKPASLDSGIGDDCIFYSHNPTTHLSTAVNRKITCQMNNDCEVEALAVRNDNGDWEIEKVISIKDHGPMKATMGNPIAAANNDDKDPDFFMAEGTYDAVRGFLSNPKPGTSKVFKTKCPAQWIQLSNGHKVWYGGWKISIDGDGEDRDEIFFTNISEEYQAKEAMRLLQNVCPSNTIGRDAG